MFVEALAVPTSAAAQSQFVCNQVIGLTLTREWYQAGFEQAPGIADDRWQLKARQSGYITEWSNPNSDFWNQRRNRRVRMAPPLRITSCSRC